MSDTQHWENSSRAKLWQERNADEKAEWVKDELRRMSSLFAMLSLQVQEIGRRVKAITKRLKESE
jgi:hypothetical protein